MKRVSEVDVYIKRFALITEFTFLYLSKDMQVIAFALSSELTQCLMPMRESLINQTVGNTKI